MADATGPNEPAASSSGKPLDDVGVPNPEPIRVLAADLPESDEVQKAYKAAMLADTAQEEARHKAKAVKASPHAEETPSGAALVKVTGISNDERRGEAYLREKTARRWGYVPVEA